MYPSKIFDDVYLHEGERRMISVKRTIYGFEDSVNKIREMVDYNKKDYQCVNALFMKRIIELEAELKKQNEKLEEVLNFVRHQMHLDEMKNLDSLNKFHEELKKE